MGASVGSSTSGTKEAARIPSEQASSLVVKEASPSSSGRGSSGYSCAKIGIVTSPNSNSTST